MAQGVLSGIGLGAVFSVGVAAVVSVVVPLEPQGQRDAVSPRPAVRVTESDGSAALQPDVAIRTPVEAGSEPDTDQPQAGMDAQSPPPAQSVPEAADQADLLPDPPPAPDVDVVAPQPVETAAVAPAPVPVPVPRTEQTTSPAAPTALAPVNTTAPEQTPQEPAVLAQPQAGEAADLTQPLPLPQGVGARAQEESPVLPNPQALAPIIPDDSEDAQITATAPPPADPQPAEQGEETFIVVEPAPQSPTDPVEESGTTDATQTPKPRVLTVPQTGTTELAQSRPRIGRPATTLVAPATDSTQDETATAEQPPAADVDARPVSRFAQEFSNPDNKPLMSIVLMDNGADLDAAAIGLPALSSFPYPVSFAVDVSLPDAQSRMQRYRADGFDVLATVNLPEGAQPADAEVSLGVALGGLTEVVGVLEGTGEGLQRTRDVADQVTRILQASGHGLVAQSKGLDSMPKLALKEGVPAASVFRDFDSQDQQPRVIRRFLDQAAFKAGQEGGVIVLGRLRPETIEALLVWGLADRAGSVALAPVSAMLLDQK